MQNKGFLHTLLSIFDEIEQKRTAFVFVLIGVFFVLFAILFVLDFVPEAKKVEAEIPSETATQVVPTVLGIQEEPRRIVAESIGLDASIENPTSRDTAVLDTALLKGAVHYPGSAILGGEGTMFLFGHSSQVPVVRNQNFKIFNEIKNLEVGDLVSVEGLETKSVYRVESVRFAPAGDVRIDLRTSGKHLVLSTCNSFGGKDSRYVVEAVFVGSYPLSRA